MHVCTGKASGELNGILLVETAAGLNPMFKCCSIKYVCEQLAIKRSFLALFYIQEIDLEEL